MDDTQDIIDKYDDISLYSDDSVFKENISPLKSPTKPPPNFIKTPLRSSPLKHAINPFKTAYKSPFKLFEDNKLDNGTELLVKETHKIISEVPNDFPHIEVLEKLLERVERLTQENNDLKYHHDQKSSDDQLKGLQTKKDLNFMTDKIKNLEISNEVLTKDLESVNEDYMKNLNELNDVKRENDLLRSKLIKYKNLYERERNGKRNIVSSHDDNKLDSRPGRSRKHQRMDNLVKMYNEMAGLLNKERKTYKPSEYDYDDQGNDDEPGYESELYEKLLKVLTQAQANKVPPQESQIPQVQVPQVPQAPQVPQTAPPGTLTALQPLYSQPNPQSAPQYQHYPYQQPQPPPPSLVSAPSGLQSQLNMASHAKPSPPTTADKKEVIFQCYLCCGHPEHHKYHQHHSPSDINMKTTTTSTKRTCARCSSKESDDHHTIDLMGEYKWSF